MSSLSANVEPKNLLSLEQSIDEKTSALDDKSQPWKQHFTVPTPGFTKEIGADADAPRGEQSTIRLQKEFCEIYLGS
jgi:hypothetical protein